MNKGTHFIGQPVFGQLINLLDKEKIAKISRENGGERYVKGFDIWQHLAIMYDSLQEITDWMHLRRESWRTSESARCSDRIDLQIEVQPVVLDQQ